MNVLALVLIGDADLGAVLLHRTRTETSAEQEEREGGCNRRKTIAMTHLELDALALSELLVVHLKREHERRGIIVEDVLDGTVVLGVDALQVVVRDWQTHNVLCAGFYCSDSE